MPASYWRLFAGTGISNLGDGVLLAALPLLAARVTGDPLSVSLISMFFTLPWLLLALPAGALIDRSDRRNVLVTADMFRAVLVGAVALVAAWSDVEIWMLWVLAFGLGAGEVFFDSASQTILPAIVKTDQLERATGWRYSVEVATNTFVGLPIGSFLFAAAVWLPFGVDAASFVLAALLAATLRGQFRATPEPDTGRARPSMRHEMAEGFRWLWQHRLLRSMAIAIALTNVAFGATESTFVLFATEELGVSERFFGVLIAIVGVGVIGAGILGGKLVDKVGRRFALIAASFTPILTMTAIGLVPVTWWVVVMTTIQAVLATMWSIIAVSLRQQLIPDRLFGRVNGVFRWVGSGAIPIGALLGGVVAGAAGLRAPYFFGAGMMLIAYLIIVVELTDSAISHALWRRNSEGRPERPTAPPVLDDTPIALELDPLDDF
jgi:MFS family permease